MAFIAKMLGHYTETLWWLFQGSTLLAAAAVLRLCGQIAVIGPAPNQIGTPTFSEEVSYYCSGFEGLGVMIAFLAFYFWTYRRELRFPQVFLLIPVGVALEWFLNSVRIAVLILLGTWNQTAVEKNFHSIAGWLFASVVAFVLVTASWRVPGLHQDWLRTEGSATFESCRSLPRSPPRNHRDCVCLPRFSMLDSICFILCGYLQPPVASISIGGSSPLYDGVHLFRRLRWVCSFSLFGLLLHDPTTHPSTQSSPRGLTTCRSGEGPPGFSSEYLGQW